jgi:hypothetical protein
MEVEARMDVLRLRVDVIYPLSIERRSSALETVDVVSLRQE